MFLPVYKTELHPNRESRNARLKRPWLSAPVRNRQASITTEAVVSIIILAAAVGVVSRFAATFRAGLNERELSAQIGIEVTNAKELISTWDIGEVTEENISKLPVNEFVAVKLEDARWQAKVVDLDEPIRVRQVSLALVCAYKGQEAKPETLTFWLPLDDGSTGGEAEGETEQ